MDNMSKKEEQLKHFDIPSLPHRRKLNGDEITYLAKLCSNVFNSTVEPKFVEMVMNYTSFVEKKMIGRIASHVEDLIIHYLMRYFSTLNAQGSISDLCHMEIGVLFGGSVLLAHHAIKLADKNIPIHVIDPFEGYYGKGKDIITNEDITENNFINNLDVFDIPHNNIQIHKGFSNDSKIINYCSKLRVLSLHIDGDHSYNGIKNDWVNYAHLVVPGGYLLIDNYNDQYWPDVMKFMNDEVLSNLHGRWEVVCFYASSLLLRRTNVQGAVDIGEQQKLFVDLVSKDKILKGLQDGYKDLQNEYKDFQKTQSEKLQKLESECEKTKNINDLFKKLHDSLIEEIIKNRNETKNAIEFVVGNRELISKSLENYSQLTKTINEELNLLRQSKEHLKDVLSKRINQLQNEKYEARLEYEKQLLQLRSEFQKSESEYKMQLAQLHSDNQAVEAWLKDQIVQIMAEKKNNEAWQRKQLDEAKQDKSNSERRLQSAINDLNNKLQDIQTKYNNISHWYHVVINSLSWKITAPIRKVKEIIFPNWKA